MAHPTIIDAERVFKATLVSTDAITLPATFPVFTKDGITTDADLLVFLDGVLKPDSEWSFEGTFTDGISAGGTVRLDAAVTATAYVYGAIAPRRLTDFGAGNVTTAALNTAIDHLWAALREQAHRISRAPKIPIPEADSDESVVDQLIPPLASRQNKVAGYDVNGRPAVSTKTVADFDSQATPVGKTANTMTALRALTPETNDVALLVGHQSANDSGGGLFHWDAASADTDDNGLTILPDGHVGNGRWKRIVIGFVTPQMFGAVGNGTTDDTTAVQAAIDSLTPVLLVGAYKITSTLTIPTNWDGALVGTHAKDSQLILVGAITGIDISHTNDTAGAVIRDIRITGDNTAGQIGIDGYYLTQNTVIENVWIDDCDIGLQIEKVFYAKFANIRIRNCTTAGLKINAATSAEQVNVTVFYASSFSGGVNCVDARPTTACYSLTFIGCAFENSEKTAFLGQDLSGLNLIGCYFENNYSDARDAGPDTLGATDAIDIKLTANSIQRPASLTACHFNHPTGWNTSSNKAAVYFGERVAASIDGNDYIAPTFGTIDYWFRWHAAAPAPVIGVNQGTSRPSVVYGAPGPPTLLSDASPDLTAQHPAKVFLTGSGASDITVFHGLYDGLVFTVRADAARVVQDNANIVLHDGVNFTMAAGDTLTLMAEAGVVYEVARSQARAAIPALADSATPSVAGSSSRHWLTGGTTTITDITGGWEGRTITVIAEHAITITDGTNLFLNGSANFVMAVTDTLTLVQKADGNWYEVARSDNS